MVVRPFKNTTPQWTWSYDASYGRPNKDDHADLFSGDPPGSWQSGGTSCGAFTDTTSEDTEDYTYICRKVGRYGAPYEAAMRAAQHDASDGYPTIIYKLVPVCRVDPSEGPIITRL